MGSTVIQDVVFVMMHMAFFASIYSVISAYSAMNILLGHVLTVFTAISFVIAILTDAIADQGPRMWLPVPISALLCVGIILADFLATAKQVIMQSLTFGYLKRVDGPEDESEGSLKVYFRESRHFFLGGVKVVYIVMRDYLDYRGSS